MRLRILVAGAAVVALAAAAAAAASSPPGGSGIVTPAGVGRLRIDSSTAAAVRAFAGRPAFARAGRSDPSMPRYDALGYGCARSPGLGRRDPMLIGPRGGARSNVFCRTIYYVDLATGKLAAFFTGSAAFRTAKGTRFGTTQADATRRERSAPTGGCAMQILERSKVATLSIPLVNAKVAGLELESTKNPVGLQFC